MVEIFTNILDSATQSIVSFQKHWQCPEKYYRITLYFCAFWPCTEEALKDPQRQTLKLDGWVKIWINGDKLWLFENFGTFDDSVMYMFRSLNNHLQV